MLCLLRIRNNFLCLLRNFSPNLTRQPSSWRVLHCLGERNPGARTVRCDSRAHPSRPRLRARRDTCDHRHLRFNHSKGDGATCHPPSSGRSGARSRAPDIGANTGDSQCAGCVAIRAYLVDSWPAGAWRSGDVDHHGAIDRRVANHRQHRCQRTRCATIRLERCGGSPWRPELQPCGRTDCAVDDYGDRCHGACASWNTGQVGRFDSAFSIDPIYNFSRFAGCFLD